MVDRNSSSDLFDQRLMPPSHLYHEKLMAMDVHCRSLAVSPGESVVLVGQIKHALGCGVCSRGFRAGLYVYNLVRV
jgi:hypothetical protein